MKKLSSILEASKEVQRPNNLHREFQEYGVYLADTLGDPKHYSLYIKYAQKYPRHLLEEALNFTKGYINAKSKAKIFMWKLTELIKAE